MTSSIQITPSHGAMRGDQYRKQKANVAATMDSSTRMTWVRVKVIPLALTNARAKLNSTAPYRMAVAMESCENNERKSKRGFVALVA